MAIFNFLISNWDSVLVVVGFIILVAVLIKRGEKKILNNILYRLVTQAEREFGAGTGELKFAVVSDWVYERLPAILRILFTAKDIDKMIETALEEAKKKWERNQILQMYIDGETPVPATLSMRTK
ncbi:hypothetical protein KQI42_09640 [Tissierella sp. MSJ-40]|uniref:Uncharacterized protein n=1 Tax=Tissierella simiarum TaxID=2841534 RepID=A0ABS6E5S3_9FIRM|nr:hypothetical protein [Tissierella simiarum]MBU5438271.1 hypothetical protein [Tissierella simiarum]